MILQFEISGAPVGQGSKRHVGGGIMIEASPRLRPYRALATDAARQALVASGWAAPPRRGPARVNITVRVRRPRSHYRTGRFADQLRPDAPGPLAARTPDLDKVARAILDACTDAGIWVDDSQVARLAVDRWWHVCDCVAVEIEMWT